MDGNEEELTPVDPAYRTVLRIQAALAAIPITIFAIVPSIGIDGWWMYAGLPALLLIAYLVIRLPHRRWSSRGYSLAEERLRTVKGVLFHSDTVVPFGRVQHLDVDQGPLERAFGLATLTVHTAGSHNASVHVPGLRHETAVEIRETIRAAIRRKTQ